MLFSFKEDINFLKAIGLSYRVEQGNDLLEAMGIGRIIPDKPQGLQGGYNEKNNSNMLFNFNNRNSRM